MSNKNPETLEKENKELNAAVWRLTTENTKMREDLKKMIAEHHGMREVFNRIANAFAYVIKTQFAGRVQMSLEVAQSLVNNPDYRLTIDKDETDFYFETLEKYNERHAEGQKMIKASDGEPLIKLVKS